MPNTNEKEKRRVADALNAAKLTACVFKLSEQARKEIRRRDNVEKEARTAKIRVG